MFYTVADRSYQCISARLEDQKLVTFPSFGSDKPSKPKLGKYFFALLQDANGIDHIIFATAVGVICYLFFGPEMPIQTLVSSGEMSFVYCYDCGSMVKVAPLSGLKHSDDQGSL